MFVLIIELSQLVSVRKKSILDLDVPRLKVNDFLSGCRLRKMSYRLQFCIRSCSSIQPWSFE